MPASRRRHRVVVAALAVGAGLLALALAEVVFPYHTTNHDEAVYLQQAAMLLEGRLFLRPPVPEAFRPWFFVVDGEAMYPKYSPVPSAVFAAGKLLGGYRLALAPVAAGCVALTYWVAREAFDRRTGLLAALLLVASPLFVVQASVFLPYVPTALLNLAFAAAYLHADRTGSYRTAAVAGLAVGLAFFSRPYTAVLFATPFVAHALWTLRRGERAVLVRQSVTAALGLLGVGVTLGYNAVVTGDPVLFPYEAFAPRDGLGFGHREILGYSQNYTPTLALRSNAEVLWAYATRWTAGGVLGTAAALVGVVVAVGRGLSPRQAAVAGVGVTVPLGNVYFWGNRNVLGALDVAGDGLISYLGPYYHVDLLVPTAVFGAVGARYLVGRTRRLTADRGIGSRRVALAGTVIAATVLGGAGVGMVAAPVADNDAVTDRYERAYEPFADRAFDDALVFLPTPYGDWLNHPFQPLRNDPGYDGDAVFALRERQFAVVDAFPNRSIYRYTYRGPWSPTTGATVDSRLQRVRHVEGSAVEYSVGATVPGSAGFVGVRLSNGTGQETATVPARDLDLGLRVADGRATLRGGGLAEPLTVPVDGRATVETALFVDYGTGAGFSYRLEYPVSVGADGVRGLTPYVEVCQGADFCGGESAYVPGAHRPQVGLNVTTAAVPE